MQILEEIEIIVIPKKKWIILLVLLLLILLGLSGLNSDSKKNSSVYAQAMNPEIEEIFDRFIFLNWSSAYTPSVNSYRIEINDNHGWV